MKICVLICKICARKRHVNSNIIDAINVTKLESRKVCRNVNVIFTARIFTHEEEMKNNNNNTQQINLFYLNKSRIVLKIYYSKKSVCKYLFTVRLTILPEINFSTDFLFCCSITVVRTLFFNYLIHTRHKKIVNIFLNF